VQPLLLVFEDLHWIDTETQALSTGSSRASPQPGFSCWSTTAPSTGTAGGTRPTTASSGSTRCPRRPPASCSRPSWETMARSRRSIGS
jgi:hypothetical protein